MTQAHVRALDARVALSEAAAGGSDELADLTPTVGEDLSYRAGDFTRRCRRARLVALVLLHRGIVADVAYGASWEDIADAAGESVDYLRKVYAADVAAWLDGEDVEPGMPAGVPGPLPKPSPEPLVAAAALDKWYRALPLARYRRDDRRSFLGRLVRPVTGGLPRRRPPPDALDGTGVVRWGRGDAPPAASA
jgi:hypothetical protein